jgi:hypothetical protein
MAGPLTFEALKKDSITTGILLALIFPAAAFVAGYLLRNNIYIINKPALPFLAAFALNLISMRLLAKKGMVKMVRGIIIATFVIMVLLFVFKLRLII